MQSTRAVNQGSDAIVTGLEQSTYSQQREYPLEDCSQTNQHNQNLQQVRYPTFVNELVNDPKQDRTNDNDDQHVDDN
jgi:hypothetical protein